MSASRSSGDRRSKIRDYAAHPFWQAVIVLVISWIIIDLGIPLLPGSSMVPNSVVFQYLATVLVGVLIYVSDSEERWTQFKQPMQAVLVERRLRPVRTALLVAVPLLVGFFTLGQVRATVGAPPNLRSIHPAPPTEITFRGKRMMLAGLENPLRHEGDMAEHLKDGHRVYYQNCMACHGDFLDGQGHYAHGFNPIPLNFQDNGTIAQLTESFVFWRIAKGGPGLPREGTPWNSAMPAWEDFLTEQEIWAVVLFLYQQTGWKPRTWEEAGAAEGGEHD
jgi:mono/diheme cytochrome c family protein